jgi:hypothetical protein
MDPEEVWKTFRETAMAKLIYDLSGAALACDQWLRWQKSLGLRH